MAIVALATSVKRVVRGEQPRRTTSGSRKSASTLRSSMSRCVNAFASGSWTQMWPPRRASSRGVVVRSPSSSQHEQAEAAELDRLGPDGLDAGLGRHLDAALGAGEGDDARGAELQAGDVGARLVHGPHAEHVVLRPPALDRVGDQLGQLARDVRERRRSRAAVQELVGAADRELSARGAQARRDAARPRARGPRSPARRRRRPAPARPRCRPPRPTGSRSSTAPRRRRRRAPRTPNGRRTRRRRRCRRPRTGRWGSRRGRSRSPCGPGRNRIAARTSWYRLTVTESCTSTSPDRAPISGASRSPTWRGRSTQWSQLRMRSRPHASRSTASTRANVRAGGMPSELPSRYARSGSATWNSSRQRASGSAASRAAARCNRSVVVMAGSL